MEADLDRDGKISFEEFTKMVENTDVSLSMTLGRWTKETLYPRRRRPFYPLVDLGLTPPQTNFDGRRFHPLLARLHLTTLYLNT